MLIAHCSFASKIPSLSIINVHQIGNAVEVRVRECFRAIAHHLRQAVIANPRRGGGQLDAVLGKCRAAASGLATVAK